MTVRVQLQDFDVGAELNQLRLASKNIGALVSFVGQVREFNANDALNTLTLEHYPEMTQKALTAIQNKAALRWDIIDSLIIHRVGTLQPLDQIVLVAVSSAHRSEAFNACAFMMDYLKNQAPFWKKEATSQGAHWVEAKLTDAEAQLRWETETEINNKTDTKQNT